MTPEDARLLAVERKIEYLVRLVRTLEQQLRAAQQAQAGIWSK